VKSSRFVCNNYPETASGINIKIDITQQMTTTLWNPFKRKANQLFFVLHFYFFALPSLWNSLKEWSSGIWHRLVYYSGTVVSDEPAAWIFTAYSENWSSRFLWNVGSSNSSGDLNPYPTNVENRVSIIMPENSGLADGMFLWPCIPDTII